MESYQQKIAAYKAQFQTLFSGYEKTLQCQRVGKRMEIISQLFRFISINYDKKTVTGLLFAENGIDDLRIFCEYFDQEISHWKNFPQEKTTGHDAPITLNVRDFGAVGDGVTSDTKAFYQAMDAIRKLNGKPSILKIPAGTYLMTEKIGMPSFTSIHTGEKIDDSNLQHAQLAIYELKNCLIKGESEEKTKIQVWVL